MIVFVVISENGGIWGIYSDRKVAQYHCAMANGDLPTYHFRVVERVVLEQ